MGQTPEAASTSLEHSPSGGRILHTLERHKNYLYATRVEDRFGNTVTYTYTNNWNEPGKLTRIEGSDGRTLTITYSGSTISKVSDGTRDWTYTYGSTSSGRKTLTSVGLPDGSAWTLDLGPITNAEILYNESPPSGEIMRTCMWNETPLNATATFVGKLIHPAGATAEYTLDIQKHGRSYVPISCNNVRTSLTGANKGADNNPNDDVNVWSTSANSLTLIKKRIYGPGLATATWDYSYEPNTSVYMYPGTTAMYPVCDWANHDCAVPPCTNEGCAKASVTTVAGPGGEWRRYRHGNTYRYNEGKLLQVESGTGPGGILRTETRAYDFSGVDQVYPARFGDSPRIDGDGFSTEYHRPNTSVQIVQQGTRFKRNIDVFDKAARPVQVTRTSEPSGTTDPPPPTPTAPTLTAPSTAVGETIHSLSWTAVAGTSYYVLERNVDGGSFDVVYSGPGVSADLVYPVAATLKYRVMACNAYGVCSAYSAQKTVVVSAPPPPAAPVITVPLTASTQLPHVVSWTAVSGAATYILERRAGSGSFIVVYNGGATSASLTYTTSNTLTYRVKACSVNVVCGAYSAEGQTIVSPGGEP